MTKPKSQVHRVVSEFNDAKADYEMSRESRFVRRRTGLAPQGGTADYHYRNEADYYRDIEKARDMDRNDAIVGQTIDRAVANIVQDGFSLDVKTGDRKLDADLHQRWLDWALDPDQCDIRGEFTFHDMESRAMRSTLLDGDVAALALEEGSLQMLEAHTIQTTGRVKNTFLGVTINQYRKPLQFHIIQDRQLPYDSKPQSVPVNVRDEDGHRILFHVYNPKRVSQTRGVTAFAPIFSVAGMFEDIQFAKLVQQQVVSCFAIFRKRAPYGNDPSSPPPTLADYGQSSSETTTAGTRNIQGISPGMEITGMPGEELQGFSPNVPNAEFFDHVRLMLQLIGVNLGLPLCLVLMDGSETNFSGWRGAVDEARKGFKHNQTNLIKRLHTPVYRWKVRQWLNSDPALRQAAQQSKVNIFGHKWNAPTWQYIDPVKDAQGDALRIQNALTSPRRLHSERGMDWAEVATEIVEDNYTAIRKAKQKAAQLNKQYDDGQPVHWRELIMLPMPNGLQMTMQDPNQVEAQREATRSNDG